MARGGARGRSPRAGGDGARDRDARGRAVRPDGAAARARRARALASSRTTRAARRRSSRRTRDAAVVLNWGPPLRRQVRVEGRVERHDGGRVARVLPDARAREPSRRVGVAAVSADRRPHGARRAVRRGERALRRRRGPAAPAVLGRLPPRPARVRALGEPAEPPARPGALRARRATAGRACGWRRERATRAVPARPWCTGPTRSRAGSPWRPAGGRRAPAAAPARGRSSSPGSTGSAAPSSPSAAA